METTRMFLCAGCDAHVTVDCDSDYHGQLCEMCELVATAILSDDDEHREQFAELFAQLEQRADEASCDGCGVGMPGMTREAVLLSWANHDRLLCDDCSDEAIRDEEAAARVASTHARAERERRYEEQRARDAQVMREGADEPRGF